MPKPRFCSIIIFVFLLVFTCCLSRACAFDDGFGSARSQEGKYFTVYYSAQLDPVELAQKLNVSTADRILTSGSTEKWGSDAQYERESLAGMLDTFFEQVSDVLDMHIYSFKGNIKVCRDYTHLKSIYEELFGKELSSFALFVGDLNTIYISPEHFERNVLGHEIAHAIISRYFAVPPPVKISEVLAGYVEYQLRKNGQR